MHVITHALISWGVANVPRNTTRRQRILATVGGVIPDVDALGAIWDTAFGSLGDSPTLYYHDYHRVVGHTAAFAAAALLMPLVLADQGKRLATAALFALAFHVHLVCDLVGSRGPDGADVWGVPYLHLPFSRSHLPSNDPVWWKWAGQWELTAWPNVAITILMLAFCCVMAVKANRTILEVLSPKLDGVVVRALRRRLLGEGSRAPVTAPDAEPPLE